MEAINHQSAKYLLDCAVRAARAAIKSARYHSVVPPQLLIDVSSLNECKRKKCTVRVFIIDWVR